MIGLKQKQGSSAKNALLSAGALRPRALHKGRFRPLTPVGEQGRHLLRYCVRQLMKERNNFGVRHRIHPSSRRARASSPRRLSVCLLPALLRSSGARRAAPLRTPPYLCRNAVPPRIPCMDAAMLYRCENCVTAVWRKRRCVYLPAIYPQSSRAEADHFHSFIFSRSPACRSSPRQPAPSARP